jgi:hypothetical protein
MVSFVLLSRRRWLPPGPELALPELLWGSWQTTQARTPVILEPFSGLPLTGGSAPARGTLSDPFQLWEVWKSTLGRAEVYVPSGFAKSAGVKAVMGPLEGADIPGRWQLKQALLIELALPRGRGETPYAGSKAM